MLLLTLEFFDYISLLSSLLPPLFFFPLFILLIFIVIPEVYKMPICLFEVQMLHAISEISIANRKILRFFILVRFSNYARFKFRGALWGRRNWALTVVIFRTRFIAFVTAESVTTRVILIPLRYRLLLLLLFIKSSFFIIVVPMTGLAFVPFSLLLNRMRFSKLRLL